MPDILSVADELGCCSLDILLFACRVTEEHVSVSLSRQRLNIAILGSLMGSTSFASLTMIIEISGLAHLVTAKQDFLIASTAFTFVLFDVVSDFRYFIPTDLAGSAGCLKPELRTVLQHT